MNAQPFLQWLANLCRPDLVSPPYDDDGGAVIEIEASRRLDELRITTWFDDIGRCWCACFGDYDEGVRICSGTTQRDAINELLDYYEQDNGEIHQ